MVESAAPERSRGCLLMAVTRRHLMKSVWLRPRAWPASLANFTLSEGEEMVVE